MISQILRFFNINIQKHQHLPLLSFFISLLLHAYYGPVLLKVAVSELPAQYLAFETVWCCFTSLLIGMLWKNRFRSIVLKNFMVLAISESAAGFCLAMYLAFIKWNVWIYAIFALLYVSLISLTIGRCIMVFRTKLWNDKVRELHDNTQSVVGDIALVIGGVAAMIGCPSLKVALMLYGCSCVIDDIGWIITWFKLKDILTEKDICSQETH